MQIMMGDDSPGTDLCVTMMWVARYFPCCHADEQEEWGGGRARG